MKFLAFLFLTCVVGSAFSFSLPSYITRCSLSDPELNQCMKDSGNKAIQHLVDGDEELGILPLSYLSEYVLEGNNFKIFLKDVHIDNLKDIKFEKLWYDKKEKVAGFTATLFVLTLTGEYTVTNAEILDDTVSGSGDFNITLVGNTFTYHGEISFYKKNNETHEDCKGLKMDFVTDHGYYNFKNLKSTKNGNDVNSYINEHSDAFKDLLRPSIDKFMLDLVRRVLNPLLEKVPFSKLVLK